MLLMILQSKTNCGDGMEELEILKLRLKNAIDGHKISLQAFPEDKNTRDVLRLLEDCYSVISRIAVVKSE